MIPYRYQNYEINNFNNLLFIHVSNFEKNKSLFFPFEFFKSKSLIENKSWRYTRLYFKRMLDLNFVSPNKMILDFSIKLYDRYFHT